MDTTIIIPTYNVEPYIYSCLESIANQTTQQDVECLIIDDCSTDKSIQIATDFIEEYLGSIVFRIIKHDKNSGLSAARNTGIKAASGDYVYFLDSDDKLFPNSIELLWNKVQEHPDVDIVQGDFVIEHHSNSILNKNFPEYVNDRRWIKHHLCNMLIPESACNRLVKRKMIIDNNLFFKEGWIQEDTMWNYTIHKHVRSISFCFEPTYFYRVNPDSIMHTMDQKKEANAFARIYNYVYTENKTHKFEVFELDFLEIMRNRVTNAIGIKGFELLDSRNDFILNLYYKTKQSSKLQKNIISRLLKNIAIKVLTKKLKS